MKYYLIIFYFVFLQINFTEEAKADQNATGKNAINIQTNSGDVKLNIVNSSEKKTDSWLRMTYTICTGPYNHKEEMLGKLIQTDKTKYQYPFHNQVFDVLKALGAFEKKDSDENNECISCGEGVVVSTTVSKSSDPSIYSIFGKKPKNYKKYSEYLLSLKPNINLLNKKDLLPDYIQKLKKYNPDYDEKVPFSVYNDTGECDGGQGLSATFYLRSLRTRSVVVENISDKVLKDISILVDAYEPSNPFEMRSGIQRDISKKYVRKEIIFPLEFLMPGESIIFPQQIQLVPPEYASGYIYESDDIKYIDIIKNETDIVSSEDKGVYEKKLLPKPGLSNDFSRKIINDIDKVLNYTQTEPIDIGAKYNIKLVSFKVDGDNKRKTYKRDFLAKNLVYVNDSCQCGSCPLLFAQNKNGEWRRLREIISNNRGKDKIDFFSYEVPISAKKISIKEVKGETSYFYDLILKFKTADGLIHDYEIENNEELIITNDNALLLDLTEIVKNYENIVGITLEGRGYYETESKTICPKVMPLDFKYF